MCKRSASRALFGGGPLGSRPESVLGEKVRIPDPACCGLKPHLETRARSVGFQVLTKNCTTKVRGGAS